MKEHYILTTEVGPSLGRRPGRRNLNRGLDSHKHASRGGLELGNKFAGGEGACQFERGRTCRIEYVWFSALQAAQTGRQILSQNFRGTTFLCGFFLWPSDDPKALACGPLPGILKVPKKFTRPCADSDLVRLFADFETIPVRSPRNCRPSASRLRRSADDNPARHSVK